MDEPHKDDEVGRRGLSMNTSSRWPARRGPCARSSRTQLPSTLQQLLMWFVCATLQGHPVPAHSRHELPQPPAHHQPAARGRLRRRGGCHAGAACSAGSRPPSRLRDLTPLPLNHPLQTYTPSTELEAANNRPFPPAVFLSYSKPSAEALVITSCPLSPSLREQGVGVRVYNEEFVFYSKYLIP